MDTQAEPFYIDHADGTQFAFDNMRKITDHHLEGKNRSPGSVLIASGAWLLGLLGAGLLFVSFAGQFKYIFLARHQDAASVIEALMFDVGMIIFCLLALGLARAGKPARTERTLIMVCSFGSAGMNYAASDTASPRSVVAFVAAPVFLAIVVDRVVAVIRRHVQGDDEGSAWTALGSVVMASARLAGMIVRYSLRFTVDAPATSRGLRQGIINAAPLPELPPVNVISVVPERPELPPTKKNALLTLYRGHKDYGNRAVASAVAKELAPKADLQWGTARSYIGEELTRIEAAP